MYQDKQFVHFLNINTAVEMQMKKIIITFGYKPYHIKLLSKTIMQNSMPEQLLLLVIKMQRHYYEGMYFVLFIS